MRLYLLPYSGRQREKRRKRKITLFSENLRTRLPWLWLEKEDGKFHIVDEASNLTRLSRLLSRDEFRWRWRRRKEHFLSKETGSREKVLRRRFFITEFTKTLNTEANNFLEGVSKIFSFRCSVLFYRLHLIS